MIENKSLSNFLLGGLSLSFVNLSGKIVNLIILPLLTFYLLPIEFGIIAIYLAIISILSMLYNPGLISATIRLYYDNDKDSIENKRLFFSSLSFLIIAPILIIISFIFIGNDIFPLMFSNFKFYPYGFLAITPSITKCAI